MIKQKNHKIVILALVAILIFTFILSINAGYVRISLLDTVKAIFGNGSYDQNLIILKFRLPRMFVAMLVGAGFALSGLLLQGLTKNDLADPGLIGVNAGATFAVFIVIFIGGGGFEFSSYFVLPFISFLGAMFFGYFVYYISSDKYTGANPFRMILNGVAVQTGLSALMVFSVVVLDDTQYDTFTKWLGGSLWRSNWSMVYVLAPWIILGIIILVRNAKKFDALSLGDELAIGIGVPLSRVKKTMLVMAVLLAGASVAISGTISFVGLIAPHISKRMFGTRHSILIPSCAIIGATLVLLGDTLGRIIIMPSEIPAGIMVAIIGAPYFLILLFKSES